LLFSLTSTVGVRKTHGHPAAAELLAKHVADAIAKANTAAKTTAGKTTTITCTKGKLLKKVTAVKPKCPAGYKVKR
jgi:hypothetical protein